MEGCRAHPLLTYIHEHIIHFEESIHTFYLEQIVYSQHIVSLKMKIENLRKKRNTSINVDTLFNDDTPCDMRKRHIQHILYVKEIRSYRYLSDLYVTEIKKLQYTKSIYEILFDLVKKIIKTHNIQTPSDDCNCINEQIIQEFIKEYNRSKEIDAEYQVWKNRVPQSAYDPDPTQLLASYHQSLEKQEQLALVLVQP